jgi:hypothetical protein
VPTREEWEAALDTPQIVTVESSKKLIKEVQAKQKTQDAYLEEKKKAIPYRKPLKVVSGFAEVRQIQVRPIQLLHRLGVITTPAVENLADVCSTWAYYRYMWAFALPKPGKKNKLRLSKHALEIDFHQKGLMSDQIGVGMAALIMGADYGATEAADVSIAVEEDNWSFTLGDASPDYLFFNPDKTVLYIVECKGTRCSRSDAVSQLRRGTEQLPSLQFTDDRPEPPSLVIGTLMSESSVRVLIVDPPGEDSKSEITDPDRPTRIGPKTWSIKNSERFDASLRNIAQAKVLAFAGADSAAVQKLERVYKRLGRLPRSTARETETSENAFGIFSGIRERVPVRDGVRVEIFQGVEEAMREGYIMDDKDRILDGRERLLRVGLKKDPRTELKGFSVYTDRRGNKSVIRSLAPDGTLLEFRITEP